MKRYYMSIVDFSEIENITADETKTAEAKEKLIELALLTEKGNPSSSQIAELSKQTSERFLYKLSRRIKNYSDGIDGVFKTFERLEERKEYTAMYMYLAILYGFIEWRVPSKISLILSSNEALKVFFSQFIKDFKEWLQKTQNTEAKE